MAKGTRPTCKDCGQRPAASKGALGWRTRCSRCMYYRKHGKLPGPKGRARSTGRFIGITINHHWKQRNRPAHCQRCGFKAEVPEQIQLDHVVPTSRGGTNHPHNLQWLCANCHVLKTAEERHTYPDPYGTQQPAPLPGPTLFDM